MGFGSGDLGLGVTFTFHNRANAPAKAAGQSMSRMSRVVTASVATINTAVLTLTTSLIGLTFIVGGMLGPFIAMTSASAKFNTQMSEVAAKARIEKTSLAYGELKDQTLALGEATKFTAIQVAEGQTFLAQTGLEVNSILEAMPGLLSLAAAGNLDLARASDIASNIMIAMGMEASEMGHIADVLAAASTRANLNVEQLGESFKFAAPFAAQMGASVAEAAAVVGMLGDMGVQGTLAGTAFKNFVAQAGKMKPDKMAKFGLVMSDFADKHGDFLKIDRIFKNVVDKLKFLGSKDRIAAMTELFGLRGNVALASQMSKAGKDLKTFILDLEGSAGEANRIAAIMLDNLEGDIIRFTSVIQTTLIVSGEELEAFLRPIVRSMTGMIRSFKQFVQTPFGRWVIRITAALAALTTTVALLGFVATIALPALWSMVAAFGALTIAVLPYILAVAAVAAGIGLLVKSMGEFRQAILDGEAATGGFIRFMQKLGGVIVGMIQIWRSWNGETFEISSSMFAMMENLGISEFVLTLGTWIVRIKEFWNGFMEGARMMWAVVQPVWDGMKSAVSSLLTTIGELFPGLSEGLGALETWKTAGKLFGIAITTFVLTPLLLLLSTIFLITKGIELLIKAMQELREFSSIGIGFLKGGLVGGVRSALQHLTDEENPAKNIVGPFDSSGGAGGGSNVDKYIEMIGKLFAEKEALKASLIQPAIIDKSSTILQSLNVDVQLDGESMGTRRIEQDELEDNRN